MKLLSRMILLVLTIILLTVPVFAEDVSESLIEEIHPEDGLDPEVISGIGSFPTDAPLRFDRRLLELIGYWLKNWELLGLGDGLRTMGVILASGLLGGLPDPDTPFGKYAGTAACLAITAAVAGDLHAMIGLGTQTVGKLHTYLRILLPGMVSLMAASGGFTGAGAISGAAALFFDVLIALMERLLIPLVSVYTALTAAEAILANGSLEKLRDFVKWICVKLIKWTLWGFSAFLTMTGLFSGSVDSQKLRSVRFAISGMVPVVGGMVSEASQTVLNAAGMLKTSVGVYGMLAVFGICIGPFLRLWLQYLLLKLSAAVCGVFGKSKPANLTDKLSEAFGILLGITGVCCILALLILTLCVRAVAP